MQQHNTLLIKSLFKCSLVDRFYLENFISNCKAPNINKAL